MSLKLGDKVAHKGKVLTVVGPKDHHLGVLHPGPGLRIQLHSGEIIPDQSEGPAHERVLLLSDEEEHITFAPESEVEVAHDAG